MADTQQDQVTTNFGAIPLHGYFYDSGKLRKKISHDMACDPDSPGHSSVYRYRGYQRVQVGPAKFIATEEGIPVATTTTTTEEEGGTLLSEVGIERPILEMLLNAGVTTVEQYEALPDPTKIKGIGKASAKNVDKSIKLYRESKKDDEATDEE